MKSPAADFIRDTQHLLRHINDARILQQNRIVQHLFASDKPLHPMQEQAVLAHVKAVVLTAAQMLQSERGVGRMERGRQRQHEIIMRCDLGGELHQVVAADLGLSERQFYRERRNACLRVGGLFLTALTFVAESAQPAPTEFMMRLNSAIRLRECAQFDVALELLRKLATEVTNAPDSIRASLEIVSTLCAAGRITEARDELDNMRCAHSDDSVCRPDATLILAEMELAKAQVAWESGDSNEAIASNKRSLAVLQTLDQPFFDHGVKIKALELMGTFYREIGDPEASLAAFGSAREILARMPDPPATLRTSLHINFASTYMLMTGGLSLATAELSQGLECATNHNLPNDTADALAMFSNVAFFRGDLESAVAYGRSALALGRPIWSNHAFAYCALNLSRAEAMLGRESLALSLIDEVDLRLPLEEDSMLRTLADLSKAEIFLSTGEPGRAAKLATAAISKLDKFGMLRYLGSAYYLEARALVVTGFKRKAAEAIGAAVGILERSGHPFSLARAYELSAKITGNVRHRIEAEQIFAILHA